MEKQAGKKTSGIDQQKSIQTFLLGLPEPF